MKLLFLTLLSTFTLTANAVSGINATCVVTDEAFIGSTGLDQIEVSDLNGDAPEANFPDAGLMGPAEYLNGSLVIDFSNECDNKYSISFPEEAVHLAHEEGVSSTLATLIFSNSELDEKYFNHKDNDRRIQVECELVD